MNTIHSIEDDIKILVPDERTSMEETLERPTLTSLQVKFLLYRVKERLLDLGFQLTRIGRWLLSPMGASTCVLGIFAIVSVNALVLMILHIR